MKSLSFDNKWEELHSTMEWGSYPSEEIIRFVARNFYKKNREEVKLLDVGCGAGSVIWYLCREGFKPYGFDGSPSAIEKARQRLQVENMNADLIVCDAANMDYEAEFFDGIIDSAMIYANTTNNIRKILKDIYRILKVGGKFFSTGLFSTDMTGFGTGEKLEENTFRQITEGSLKDRGTVHFFDKDEIEEVWNDAGFKTVKIDYLMRTDNGGKDKTSYYMVQATK